MLDDAETDRLKDVNQWKKCAQIDFRGLQKWARFSDFRFYAESKSHRRFYFNHIVFAANAVDVVAKEVIEL